MCNYVEQCSVRRPTTVAENSYYFRTPRVLVLIAVQNTNLPFAHHFGPFPFASPPVRGVLYYRRDDDDDDGANRGRRRNNNNNTLVRPRAGQALPFVLMSLCNIVALRKSRRCRPAGPPPGGLPPPPLLLPRDRARDDGVINTSRRPSRRRRFSGGLTAPVFFAEFSRRFFPALFLVSYSRPGPSRYPRSAASSPSSSKYFVSNLRIVLAGWEKMSSNGVTEDDDFGDEPFREY